MAQLDPAIYTIAWIAPLEIEAISALHLLDNSHHGRFSLSRGDDYVFHAGDVCGHNVVIATLPAGQEYGTGSAAALAAQVKRFFPNLWFGLLVGVAAGLPLLFGPERRDIRLGDVLVALPEGDSAGLFAYDLGKECAAKGFQPLRSGHVLAVTETVVRSAIGSIKIHAPNDTAFFLPFYHDIKHREHASGNFMDPGQDNDVLYDMNEHGVHSVIAREPRPKSRLKRNELRDRYKVIGIEMEAAGTMNRIPVGVIRGVCDYGDERKNKEWQPYAAAMAGAYAKAVLAQIGPKILQSAAVSESSQGSSTIIRDLPQPSTKSDGYSDEPCRNEYFETPQSVTSLFTGREDLLDDLSRTFIQSGNPRAEAQRRFVVYGLGGAGKTQFCCKFAEENRDRFWGIFWIDASSEERVEDSFKHIAALALLPRNANAALHWLSKADKKWLLIIDNANDSRIPLENYFPKGRCGHILIATRNPALKIHGNTGPEFYNVSVMGFKEAKSLLLRSSGVPAPWARDSEDDAMTVTKALGLLALAIVQAGAAIRSGLCKMKDYLKFYQRSFDRLRPTNRSKGPSKNEMDAYATWELNYEQLEKKNTEASEDAIQLLQVFAFFHRENLSPEIFSKALQNFKLEVDQQQKESGAECKATTWKQWFREMSVLVVAFLKKNRGPPPIPRLLRDGRQSGRLEECEDRILYALRELTDLSLIERNSHNDTYVMHPIIHIYARERPRMKLVDQVLWADVAGIVLASSILLPPLGVGEEVEEYHISLLAHIEQVELCRDDLRDRVSKKEPSWTSWLTTASTINIDLLRMKAKFAFIYATCAKWDKARLLLEEVKMICDSVLGAHDPRSRRATLFLSDVLVYMDRSIEAANLQQALLKTCSGFLGKDHPDTLRVMSKLGGTLWQQGQYTTALDLQRTAVAGMRVQLTAEHPDTLEAIDNLGRTVSKFWARDNIEESRQLHTEAIEGMTKIHGAEHAKTLTAKENLCRILVLLGGDYFNVADVLMNHVLQTRKTKLGKEHPQTLLAMANYSIVKCGIGDFDAAEKLISVGLPIAERNLGENHIGALFGRQILACILMQQDRLTEAEEMLRQVTEKQKSMESRRGNYHPDRLGALIDLARCCYLQGKIAESIRTCEEALQGFTSISIQEHPLASLLKAAREQMLRQEGQANDNAQDAPQANVIFPAIFFKFPED
ncbi:tetratricopeptide repeat domain-containing protein [Metarhizium brunneum]